MFKMMMVTALSLLIPAAAAFGNGVGGGHMGGWDHMMDFSRGGIVMWFLLIILIGAIIYYILRKGRLGAPGEGPPESSLEILKKRYARGEITEDEFEEMKKNLEK